MYQITFTKEEIDAAIIQIGARLDDLEAIQKEEGRNENIERVLELEEFMKPIRSFKDKLVSEKVKV